MKRILKFICILSISLTPISSFGQGKLYSHKKKKKKENVQVVDFSLRKPTNLEAIDLGLPSGLKWASCNIGASEPSDFGSYFAWGEIHTRLKYTTGNGFSNSHISKDISGNAKYDTARANWGDTWRLPTKAEFKELCSYCTWEWTSQNGHNGYKVTGPNGNYIFLPAAGLRTESSLYYYTGSMGFYWSSTPYDSEDSYYLSFDSDRRGLYRTSRQIEKRVRPVSD